MKIRRIVGAKNASLGEMIQQLKQAGIRVPLGFAVTVKGYWDHLEHNNLIPQMKKIIERLDSPSGIASVQEAGKVKRSYL